jgi:hypothetical protein
MNFQRVAYSALLSCVTTVWVGGSSGEDEEGDERNIERVPSFTKAHTAYKTVKPFLYVHSFSEHDK